ncbi:MAG: hypothetical protein ACRDRJ_39930 [Streptosporangiaceae bacterium]
MITTGPGAFSSIPTTAPVSPCSPSYYSPRSPARQTRDKIREIERLNPGKKVILAPIDAEADTAA